MVVLAVPVSLLVQRVVSGDDARDPITAGRAAPPFSLTSLDGARVSLSDLAGKPVVLNFWGAYCEDCRVGLVRLIDAQKRHPELALAGILYRERPAAGKAEAEAAGAGWPQLVDPDADVARAYGVDGAPVTFFIDRAGKIAGHLVGPITDRLVERQLTRIL